jgi:hypothetical protein
MVSELGHSQIQIGTTAVKDGRRSPSNAENAQRRQAE